MLDLAVRLIRNLLIYPDNMAKNLYITRGLVYSQTVLLKLVDKGVTREEAYRIVQTAAMQVWENKEKDLRNELINSAEARQYLTEQEINEIFQSIKMLQNVDYIFTRSVDTD
jgi:adenylosuccinate lyase